MILPWPITLSRPFSLSTFDFPGGVELYVKGESSATMEIGFTEREEIGFKERERGGAVLEGRQG